MFYSPYLGYSYEVMHLRASDRPLLRHALGCAGISFRGTRIDGYWNYVKRPAWAANSVGLKLCERFERWLCHRYGIDEEFRFVPTNRRGWECTLVWLFLWPYEMTIRAVKVRDLAEDAAARA